MLRILVHLAGALQFTYACYYDWNYVHIPSHISNIGSAWGGKLKFLTFWDAILQSIFFWICLINDFVGSNEINPKSKPQIRRVKDFMHATLGFPLAAFVAVTFWVLYGYDRELIFPKSLDLYFPNWLNHVMHTNILIFSVVELICSFRVYPDRTKGLKFLSGFMLIYLSWTFVIYGKSGHWVYPIMEVLNWPERVAFFVVLLAFVLVLYLVGEALNKAIWGSELKQIKDATSSKKAKKKSK